MELHDGGGPFPRRLAPLVDPIHDRQFKWVAAQVSRVGIGHLGGRPRPAAAAPPRALQIDPTPGRAGLPDCGWSRGPAPLGHSRSVLNCRPLMVITAIARQHISGAAERPTSGTTERPTPVTTERPTSGSVTPHSTARSLGRGPPPRPSSGLTLPQQEVAPACPPRRLAGGRLRARRARRRRRAPPRRWAAEWRAGPGRAGTWRRCDGPAPGRDPCRVIPAGPSHPGRAESSRPGRLGVIPASSNQH